MSGITDELINKVNMDYTEAAEKLKAGEIDAFFCTAGTRTEVIGPVIPLIFNICSAFFSVPDSDAPTLTVLLIRSSIPVIPESFLTTI